MIRVSHPSRTKSAFTLLEVILALSIGLILLGVLYSVLSSQVRLTRTGRDILDDSTIARATLTRISTDIQSTLGPLDRRVLPDYATPTTEEPTEDGSTADPASTAEPAASTGDTAKPTTGKTTTTTAVRNTVDFNVGVDGGEDYLILTVGRAQRLDGMASPAEASGLRRILYWIVPGERGGLARYEIKNATGEEANLTPQDVPDPEGKVIAPEVLEIGFEFYDGSSWASSWRGSDTAGDINNPLGPPSAIRMNLKIRSRALSPSTTGEARTNSFQHVVAIPTGNHFPQGGS